jgi:hypothetical protein
MASFPRARHGNDYRLFLVMLQLLSVAFSFWNEDSTASALPATMASYSSPTLTHRLLVQEEQRAMGAMEFALQSDIRRMARTVLEHAQAYRDYEGRNRRSNNVEGRSLQDLSPTLELDTTSLQPVCQAIQDNFVTKSDPQVGEEGQAVKCVCTGSTTSSFSIACEFQSQLCSPLGTICGRPFIGMSVERYSLFSVTACVYDYTRRGVPLNDTCIGMEVCPDDEPAGGGDGTSSESSSSSSSSSSSPLASVRFCGCTAQYGTKVCPNCTACDSGRGIFMDCSEYNAEVVTPECRSPDVDLDWSGASGSVVGLIPNLNGLCTQIESGLQNRVECNCADTGRGNFNLTCELTDNYCTEKDEFGSQYCGSMKSTTHFQEGAMTSVTSCSDFASPADLLQTCVTFHADPPNSTDNTAATFGGWTSCQASYGGKSCRSCGLCGIGMTRDNYGDAQRPMGVALDCTNVGPEWAAVRSCQSVEPSLGALEFVPHFVNVPLMQETSSSSRGGSMQPHTDWRRFLVTTLCLTLLGVLL